MQISGHGKADQLARLLLGVQDAESTAARSSSPSQGPVKDEVHISEQAQELRRIMALTQDPDPARAERIDRIRQDLDGGTYDVSGRRVGDALIRNVLTDAVV
ncbi:MAG: flagellar biosynthesis anti-sigma factor FlgM [Nitrospira sp.]|nr:flagellar biosynthesis anti-sigma factor FlgM [Nitrospira sp.]